MYNERWSSFRTPLLMSFLYLLFGLSGFTALVYQIAWQRMLGFFGGADSISATITVGAFLLGLGLGNLLAGTFADRLSDRGAIYGFAVCEMGIAVFAVASKFLLYDFLFNYLTVIADQPLARFPRRLSRPTRPNNAHGILVATPCTRGGPKHPYCIDSDWMALWR